MTGTDLFLEVLARNGEIISRYRGAHLPLRIGRAYDNDVLLDDPYVAAHHLVIEKDETGQWIARDLGSQNGLYFAAGKTRRIDSRRQTRIALDPDTVIRIGHTLLRVRDARQSVEPELIDTTAHAWEGAPPIVTALLGVTAVSALSIWLTDTEGQEFLQYLITMIPQVIGMLLWATLWSILNRIFGDRLRFGRHLFIGVCGVIFIWFWDELSSFAAFALGWESLSRFSFLGILLILAGVFYHHILTVRPHALRLARLTAAGLLLIGSGLTLMNHYMQQHRFGSELYMSSLKPPAMRLTRDTPSQDFFQSIHALKTQVDQLRRKRPVSLPDQDSPPPKT